MDDHRAVVTGPAHVGFHREAVIGRRGEGLKRLQRVFLVATAVGEDVRTGWSSAVEVFDGLPDGGSVAEGGLEAAGELACPVTGGCSESRVKYHPRRQPPQAERSK